MFHIKHQYACAANSHIALHATDIWSLNNINTVAYTSLTGVD